MNSCRSSTSVFAVLNKKWANGVVYLLQLNNTDTTKKKTFNQFVVVVSYYRVAVVGVSDDTEWVVGLRDSQLFAVVFFAASTVDAINPILV